MNSKSNFDKNIKQACLPAMDFLPEWINRLTEDYEEEVDNDDFWSIKLLEEEGRKAVWNMCLKLGLNNRGVPGQACRLVERYLAKQIKLNITLRPGSREWESFKQMLRNRLPLTMASCIQLAAKMNNARYQINVKVVRASLMLNGMMFSHDEIKFSEFYIYNLLDFRIPLWTSVEIGEALAVEVGFPQKFLEGVTLFVDIAEYCRNRLNQRLRWAANFVSSPSRSVRNGRVMVSTLHLAAGSVSAAASYLNYKGPDPTPRLATATQASISYLRYLSSSIIGLDDTAITTEKTKTAKKRRLSSTEPSDVEESESTDDAEYQSTDEDAILSPM